MESISEKLTNRELSLIFEGNTPGQAVIAHKSKPEEEKKVKKLVSQLGYEYSFVFVFAPAVKGLYPIISHLIQDMNIPNDVSKESIVYLTICTIGILLNEPKDSYKGIIQRLKDDGLFRLIKPLTSTMKGMKSIFSFISKKLGKVITSYAEMFAYTSLFVPFALVFKDIVEQETTSVVGILKSFGDNPIGSLISTGVGMGVFTAKHFMEDILNGLKSFKDRGISSVKKIIDKVRKINLPREKNNDMKYLESYSSYDYK